MAVVLERFAEQARAVVADTMATAQAQGIAEVRAEHLHLSLTRVADGATAAALTENHLDEALVTVPTGATLDAADQIMAPLHDRCLALNLQSRTLAALRDTLLPKLISGELRIRDAERAVAAA